MKEIENIISKFSNTNINITAENVMLTALVIIVSILIYFLIQKIITRSTESNVASKKLNNRSRTYIKMILSVIRYILIIVTVLVILQINGVNVSSLLAGLGIAGAVVGLAVQDALKDIIRGFTIISDDYFSVGDVVKYGDITGKVIVIGIKTTKIQDIATDNVVSIANRNIEQIEVVSKALYIDFPLPYELNVLDAEKVIGQILFKFKSEKNIENAEYKGVKKLDDSSIKYLFKITCNPENRLQTSRDAYRCILLTLEENNIAVPYNQLDIHQK